MKYFLHTEFMERRNHLELISIGIVAEDGRTFYAENIGADLRDANEFVKENVIPHLWWLDKVDSCFAGYNVVETTEHSQTNCCGDLGFIESCILQFIGDDIPEFWGYYCDYDWVLFCWLFGAMCDLPKGWPMYCRDLKQEIDRYLDFEPKPAPTSHNALDGAKWIKDTLLDLQVYQINIPNIKSY